MSPVQTALIFVNKPAFALETFLETLNRRVGFLGETFEREVSQLSDEMRLISQHRRVSICWGHQPLPASTFDGAMDNLLSEPFRETLAEKVFDHAHFMVVSVSQLGRSAAPDSPKHSLAALELLHCVTTLLAEWHHPVAVHWRSSNQLLTGRQYLTLASDQTPWALFARACLDDTTQSLGLTGIADLTGGARIHIDQTTISVEQAHAISLAYLRQLTIDGDAATTKSFQTSAGDVILVHHVVANGATPPALRLVPWRTNQDPAAPHDARSVENAAAAQGLGRLKSALGDVEPARAEDPKYDAKWLSYLMLLLMPPLGLALVVSNTLLGPSLFRSGLMTLGSLALAMLVISGLSISGNARLTAWTNPAPAVLEIQSLN